MKEINSLRDIDDAMRVLNEKFDLIDDAMRAIKDNIISMIDNEKRVLPIIQVDDLGDIDIDFESVVLALRDEKTGDVHLFFDPEFTVELLDELLGDHHVDYIGHLVITEKEEVEKYLPLVTGPLPEGWDL